MITWIMDLAGCFIAMVPVIGLFTLPSTSYVTEGYQSCVKAEQVMEKGLHFNYILSKPFAGYALVIYGNNCVHIDKVNLKKHSTEQKFSLHFILTQIWPADNYSCMAVLYFLRCACPYNTVYGHIARIEAGHFIAKWCSRVDIHIKYLLLLVLLNYLN